MCVIMLGRGGVAVLEGVCKRGACSVHGEGWGEGLIGAMCVTWPSLAP